MMQSVHHDGQLGHGVCTMPLQDYLHFIKKQKQQGMVFREIDAF